MGIGKSFPYDVELSARHGLHEIVIPHISVIPRDEIALKIILNLIAASGERTDLHFKQCDIVVHLSLDLHLAVLPLVDPYTEHGAGSRGDDHHVIEDDGRSLELYPAGCLTARSEEPGCLDVSDPLTGLTVDQMDLTDIVGNDDICIAVLVITIDR